ncbi:MAG: hypothetical protein E5X64_38375 [Mesorhizobium sp.]|nr:MAG: hypothetical protein E5X61_32095 [Mesorhizobium sp.]TIQ75473.1 MAG: hypothetical protein E5X64_38375 [Mesorhizobium sp.]
MTADYSSNWILDDFRYRIYSRSQGPNERRRVPELLPRSPELRVIICRERGWGLRLAMVFYLDRRDADANGVTFDPYLENEQVRSAARRLPCNAEQNRRDWINRQ